MKILLGIAASAAIAAGGLGLAASANAARAPELPAPTYHWCPGEFWNPIWGFNMNWGECHADGILDRDRPGDWRGDDGRGRDNGPGDNRDRGPDRGPDRGNDWNNGHR
ncbi:hypothetical protein FZI91_18010 [Mycobacterium sp. CBMA271]|uniref:hypothetical protein n=1 Tax=unclassified Mycobacteroides TaxID=2618759 RepID=UPI0012DE015F|nr:MULTISPECIES: hypothetical protein [unclassified Mycobacteroides]MUM15491.1 hypothetical protein [Mycobacteroides sp. CBMA 326]MUM23579.1 hypothetical protein [Mycobacteroides sp. CBMA 271]